MMELLVLTYLWLRNELFDRPNALLHLPVVLQEAGQAMLWPHVTRERNAALGFSDPAIHLCSASNTAWSFAVMVPVILIGPWFMQCTLWECTAHNRKLEQLKISGTDKKDAISWRVLVGEVKKDWKDGLVWVYHLYLKGYAVVLLFFSFFFFIAPGADPQAFTVSATIHSEGNHIQLSHPNNSTVPWVARCTSRGPYGHQVRQHQSLSPCNM